MAYVFLLLVLLIVVGLGLRAVLAARAGGPTRRADADVESGPAPPRDPDAPIPGSATRRHQQGKP